MRSAPKVFVDTCCLQHGFPFRKKTRQVSGEWGPITDVWTQEFYERVALKSELLAREVPLLKNISLAAEGGRIGLFTSDLVMFEIFGGRGTSMPSTPGHAFERTQIKRLRSPFQISLATGERFKDQLERKLGKYPDHELHKLTGKLGKKKLVDCVHLLTADRLSMDFYLTTDGRLIDSYRSQRDELSVWPVLPSELLRNLHLSE